MGAHPEMVGGEGRFDTDLIREPRARLVAKAGAEGVHGVWAPDRGLGLAVKAEDGADRGYRLVVVELLRRLRLLDDTEAQAIRRRYCDPEIRTIAGEVVGRMEAVLDGVGPPPPGRSTLGACAASARLRESPRVRRTRTRPRSAACSSWEAPATCEARLR